MMVEFELPGKLFLFGEYVALIGGPALVYTFKPYFQIQLQLEDHYANDLPRFVHPKSPAGQYLKKLRLKTSKYWNIKHLQQAISTGGLGQSSAEYLSVFLANELTFNQWQQWWEQPLNWRFKILEQARNQYLALFEDCEN